MYSADGYVTAWFMWHLQNDTNAVKAFVGSNAEILSNPIYSNMLDIVWNIKFSCLYSMTQRKKIELDSKNLSYFCQISTNVDSIVV